MDVHRIYRMMQDRFRPRRMREFVSLLDVTNETRIVDLGGYEQNWEYIEVQPPVCIVNLDAGEGQEGRFTFVRGDATRLPFRDNEFDVAYSNSVIEHVGDWSKQQAFAAEVRRVAASYYVQTPYRWFPVEPHFIAPFIHWLPLKIYRSLIPLASLWWWLKRPRREEIEEMLSGIQLLNRRQMNQLFPDASLVEEKFFGMTKSLISVRHSPSHELEGDGA